MFKLNYLIPAFIKHYTIYRTFSYLVSYLHLKGILWALMTCQNLHAYLCKCWVFGRNSWTHTARTLLRNPGTLPTLDSSGLGVGSPFCQRENRPGELSDFIEVMQLYWVEQKVCLGFSIRWLQILSYAAQVLWFFTRKTYVKKTNFCSGQLLLPSVSLKLLLACQNERHSQSLQIWVCFSHSFPSLL